MSIYDTLDVPEVVNACGTKTRIGGSLIRPEAADAMREAANSFARISDLQARASELIADVTGAQAGYVTSGASAGLTLAAAACIAGDDLDIMARLPETDGIADEIVIPRTHRSGYDRAYRLAGATIVDVGTNDRTLGTGSANTEPWEIDAAITDRTVAIGYMQKTYTDPPLEVVTEIAHEYDIPVIVDAAAELPPAENISRFIDAGADLIAFSGGKGIRGPQTTGLLAGRADLIRSVALQQLDMHAAHDVWVPPTPLFDPAELEGVPRQGVGRGMKVGKEELVGILTALELFLEEDHDSRRAEWADRSELLDSELSDCPGLTVDRTEGGKIAVAPEVVVTVGDTETGITASELVRALRSENPRVYVGADAVDHGRFTLNPMCLTDEEAGYVVDRVSSYL